MSLNFPLNVFNQSPNDFDFAQFSGSFSRTSPSRSHTQSIMVGVCASLNVISNGFHLGDSSQYNKKHCHSAVVNFTNLFYCLHFKGVKDVL